MRKQTEIEIKVGIFVAVGLGLIMFAILFLGGTQNPFSKKNNYSAHFSSVDGLITGAKVILAGVPVGSVENIVFDQQKRDIRVEFSVTEEALDWIRKDSTLEVATQGVLGDKYISIHAGHAEQPPLPPGSAIPNEPSKDITQFLTKGDQLMVNLNNIVSTFDHILKSFEHEHRSEIFFKGVASTAKNLSLTTEKLHQDLSDAQLKRTLVSLSQILEKVNNGTGTIGALINNPALYDEMRALMGGANRNRIIRNLVRQTIKDSEESTSPSTPSPAKK